MGLFTIGNRGGKLRLAYTNRTGWLFALDQISKKLLAEGFREQFQLLRTGHPAGFLDARCGFG
jgi:hypothetical protein